MRSGGAIGKRETDMTGPFFENRKGKKKKNNKIPAPWSWIDRWLDGWMEQSGSLTP